MKKAKWLCTLVLALCLALCMGVAVTAAADGELTVGSISAAPGLDVNGTADGKTQLSFTNGNALQGTVEIGNYVNESIEIKLVSDADVRVRIALLSYDWSTALAWENDLGQWDAKTIPAGQETTILSNGYTEGTTAANCHLCIYFYDTGTVTINSFKVGEVSYTPSQYIPPETPTDTVLKGYSDWTGSNNVTISQNNLDTSLTSDGITDGIATVTFSDAAVEDYTDSVTGETAKITHITIPIDGVPTGWSNLYVKYKATSGISAIEAHMNEVLISETNPKPDLQGKKVFMCGNIFSAWNVTTFAAQTDGYKLSVCSIGTYAATVTQKTALVFSVKFAAGAIASEQSIEFGGIAFANAKPSFATDDPNVTSAVGPLTQDQSRFTITQSGDGTVISWAAKDGANYNFVNVPVTNWQTSDRFVKMVFSADKDFTMAVYEGNSNVVSGHTLYKGGVEQTLYVDTTKAQIAIKAGDVGLRLYLDTQDESEAKVLTIKSIEFVETAVASKPEETALTINYAAETVTFDAETIIVYSDQGTTAIESGAKVTPGTKLYMRTKASDGYVQSELAEFNVPARPAAEEITPTASATAITVTKEGYSFKIGDGEWTAVGAFTGLTAGTEYTITYRKDATATSFASEEKTVKVTTTAAAGEETPAPAKKGCKNAVSGGALYAFLAVCFAVIAFCGVRLIKKSKRD